MSYGNIAMVAAAAIAAGGSAYSANQQVAGTRGAAKQQRIQAQEAREWQERMYGKAQETLLPFTDPSQARGGYKQMLDYAGKDGWLGNEQKYMDLIEGLNVEDYVKPENDAVYQWQQRQVEEATKRAGASLGSFGSRDTANMLLDANMNLAANYGDRAYARGLDKYNSKLGQYQNLFNLENLGSGQKWDRAYQLGNYELGAITNSANLWAGQGNNIANTIMTGSAQYGNTMANAVAAEGRMWDSIGQIPGQAMEGYILGNYMKDQPWMQKSMFGGWGNIKTGRSSWDGITPIGNGYTPALGTYT